MELVSKGIFVCAKSSFLPVIVCPVTNLCCRITSVDKKNADLSSAEFLQLSSIVIAQSWSLSGVQDENNLQDSTDR